MHAGIQKNIFCVKEDGLRFENVEPMFPLVLLSNHEKKLVQLFTAILSIDRQLKKRQLKPTETNKKTR